MFCFLSSSLIAWCACVCVCVFLCYYFTSTKSNQSSFSLRHITPNERVARSQRYPISNVFVCFRFRDITISISEVNLYTYVCEWCCWWCCSHFKIRCSHGFRDGAFSDALVYELRRQQVATAVAITLYHRVWYNYNSQA